VRAGSLTDGIAIEQTQRYQSRAVLLWANKLNDLKRYRAWLTEGYTVIKVWAAGSSTRPVLLQRRDAPHDMSRQPLRAGLAPAPDEASYGPWRLVSYGLDRLAARPDDTITATLEWETSGEFTADARVILRLLDANGNQVTDERQTLALGSEKTSWLFWVAGLDVPPRSRPGRYELTVKLRVSKDRQLGQPVSLGSIEITAA